ncbi:MAG TPA: hypothetical protein VE221_07665, partial [Sphingomicrobium sp.]|nr:hypothetical protein [Sphingomicrobium sp.]
GTISDALDAGRPVHRLAVPIAAWILFLKRQSRSGAEIVDPLNKELKHAASDVDPVRATLSLRRVFPERLGESSDFGSSVAQAYTGMTAKGVGDYLADLSSASGAGCCGGAGMS